MFVDLYTKEGKVAGQIELQDDIFAIEPNEHVMHLAVVAHLANLRQGTRKTKVRSEVSGGGKKPWKQKGRGTARSGSSRSPVWVGGGTIHGPKPSEFSSNLPKKIKRLARKSAFSLKAAEKNIIVVEDFALSAIKTKEIAQTLKNLNVYDIKTLLLLPDVNFNVYMSARNIDGLTVKLADKASTYDILNNRKVVMFKGAIDPIVKTFNNL